jgi:hypothetical protein
LSSEIAGRLSEQTRGLVSRFEGRVAAFADRSDILGLLRSVDRGAANASARDYFGEGEHLAIGIDGSRDFDERLQMMLFYANATGYSCPFNVGKEMSFDLAKASRSGRLSASAAIPLWAEDFSDVLPDLPELEIEIEYSMERIPNAFMTLAELHLATKATESAKVVFMDRPLSSTYSMLARDARLLMKTGSTSLSSLPGQQGRDTMLDINLALSLGPPSFVLPGRRRYATHRALRELMKEDVSQGELASRLHLDDAQLAKTVKSIRAFDRKHSGALLEDASAQGVRLRASARQYWQNCVKLAEDYADRVFEKGDAPLSLGGQGWLTILDVSTLALITLQRLCQLGIEREVLVIGIAKDTAATDISRAVLPYAATHGGLRLKSRPPALNSDRAFLSILTGMNRGLEIPWRTVGYDSAFSTVFASKDGGGFRPARKLVSREELFVRSYFQSGTLGGRGNVRSQVFLSDRIFDPSRDSGALGSLEVEEPNGPALITPYFEGLDASAISNLVLHILSMTDNPEVYEAFGHNQLLYLADKAVKSEIRLMRSSLRGVADLRLGAISKREQVYGIMTPYRDQRSEAEASRMREATRS